MSKISNKLWKPVRNTLKGITLTSFLFAFQACYGMPTDFGLDIQLKGKVISSDTKEPIPGIKVSIDGTQLYDVTKEDGTFDIYHYSRSNFKMLFQDTDGSAGGEYLQKDTIISFDSSGLIEFNIELDAK